MLRPTSTRLSVATSAAVAPFQWIRSLPLRPSSSIVQSRRSAAGASSSTNVGGIALPDTESAAIIRRFSFPPSRCSVAAVGLTPSRRANSIAADHNSSGIGCLPCRFCRQFSKRVRTSSRLRVSTDLRRLIVIPPCRSNRRKNELPVISADFIQACRKDTLHPLKSPSTVTCLAFGAHTAK